MPTRTRSTQAAPAETERALCSTRRFVSGSKTHALRRDKLHCES